MTKTMFFVFTTMSIVLPTLIGLLLWSKRRTFMFIIICLGLTWGVGLGTLISNNSSVWFFVTTPLITLILFTIAKLIDPVFFKALNAESNENLD